MIHSILGFNMFLFRILKLVSLGKKETLEAIETHCKAGDLCEYILDTYSSIISTKDIADMCSINIFYSQLSDIDKIISQIGLDENDGLLLIIVLALN